MVVRAVEQMPLRLAGDWLEFEQQCQLRLDLPGVTITRIEQAGNRYDGATIPRAAWSIIGHPLEDRFRWASYWHDRICEASTYREQRRFADAVFLELLRRAGVERWRRVAMWAACRIYATTCKGLR